MDTSSRLAGSEDIKEKTVSSNNDRLSAYLEGLGHMFGDAPGIHRLMAGDNLGQDIVAVVYADRPEEGHVTAFTYGLSCVEAIGESDANTELCLTMRSSDPEWGMVPTRMVAALRGRLDFSIGQAVGYFKAFTEETAMSSMILSSPVLPQLAEGLVVGEEDPRGNRPDRIRFIGVYPIYASERDFVYASGFDAFWQLAWDRVDPLRPPVL